MPFGGASLICWFMSWASAKQEAVAVAVTIILCRSWQPFSSQKLEFIRNLEKVCYVIVNCSMQRDCSSISFKGCTVFLSILCYLYWSATFFFATNETKCQSRFKSKLGFCRCELSRPASRFSVLRVSSRFVLRSRNIGSWLLRFSNLIVLSSNSNWQVFSCCMNCCVSDTQRLLFSSQFLVSCSINVLKSTVDFDSWDVRLKCLSSNIIAFQACFTAALSLV